MILLVIIGIVLLVTVVVMWKYKKQLHIGNLTLISGGVKTGKTQLSVCIVMKLYKKQLKKWRINCIKAKIKKQSLPEKPLIYSNMPLGCEYVPLSLDLVTGKSRFAYGSIIYLNEVSLVSGSKDIKDEIVNDWLLQMYKLCAHMTKGGYWILDTQSPQDLHYTIKRSLSTYLCIYRTIKLPHVSIMWVRENLLVDGENTIAIDSQTDSQDNPKEGGKRQYWQIVSNKYWQYYDQYAYSYLTDNLPVYTETVKLTKKSDKKVHKLVRIKEMKK